MDAIFDAIKSYTDTFREEPSIDETKNEDILKLEENIRKIKDKKKNRKKFAENYSNIETLNDIYDDSTTKSQNGSVLDNNILNDGDVVENFQEGARSKKKKKKGKSKKKSKGKSKKIPNVNELMRYIRKYIKMIQTVLYKGKDAFFYAYNTLDKLIAYIALSYVHIVYTSTDPKIIDLKFDLSNATKTQFEGINKDNGIVKYMIYSIITLPLCLYATYNWFYLLVYVKPNEDNPDIYERPFDDVVRTKITFDGIQPSFIRNPIHFLLNYTIAPLYWVDKLFNNKYYTNMAINYIQWNVLNYMLLFIGVVFINREFGLFESLNNFISNRPSYLYRLCGIVIAGTFLYNMCIHIFNPPTSISMLRVFKYLFAILVTFIYIIVSTFIAGMSINMSCVVILLYVWLHSLFGIVLYNKNGFSGVFKEIKNIDAYIKKDYANLDTGQCDGLSFFEKLFMQFIQFLNDYRTLVSMAIVIGLNIYYAAFNSIYLKVITIVLLLLFLLIIYQILKYNNNYYNL